MAFTRAWRNFKRMQDLTVLIATLIYAGAVVHAVGRLPGGMLTVLTWTLGLPSLFLAAAFVLPLAIPPVKRWLARYVWMSFQAGFGQTPGSIVTGLALLMGAAMFIYWQVASVARSGEYR